MIFFLVTCSGSRLKIEFDVNVNIDQKDQQQYKLIKDQMYPPKQR